MRIYKIAGRFIKTPFPELEEKVRSINVFWSSIRKHYIKMNIKDFNIGELNFKSTDDAIQYLRKIYVEVNNAQAKDAGNKLLYEGWKKNLVACVNTIKDEIKKYQQPELF